MIFIIKKLKYIQLLYYKTNFIEVDLTEYIPKEKYDLAICQTVLQHIPNPIKILEKMKDSLKPNGILICIEMSRDVSTAATYVDRVDYGKLNVLGIDILKQLLK